jgi:hypothetical protein
MIDYKPPHTSHAIMSLIRFVQVGIASKERMTASLSPAGSRKIRNKARTEFGKVYILNGNEYRKKYEESMFAMVEVRPYLILISLL